MSTQTQNIEKKITLSTITKMKGKEPITMVTAYDALFAKLFDGQVEMILVGDSLNMSFYGKPDTLSATMDQMIYHTRAVCNGAKLACIVFDMPFGSYLTPEQALKNAARVYRETCADAVKIEGGKEKASIIKSLSSNGIAVVAHIGLMPQHVRSEGGYKVRGKNEMDVEVLVEDALALESAGAKIVLVEGVNSEAAKRITEAINVPTIGIGAGNTTDGQVLVWSDMFGFFEAFSPKFVKQYCNGAKEIQKGLEQYVDEVKNRTFPADEHTYWSKK
ncbi:MAG: 3-methyl-2-oxobutanoate hydroxymethyltransferase [Sulfurovum sp.]|nr:3-methyl-2-oxobutanoate hydroxymethyltransferase [Sulfurovum sp.]MCB4748927.1 3-methyl-2-oxobutanoate hydroxymethyltransferase [Sulfurovum sp.]MCB4752756.1 3-methyl-2-oxobutanoate hydroxymethyltransferase [Sulfurovum sp.]MCB4754134.1 3-methyl-2-oxobutanoate hydroxymethyltransferase [Sulfurovum sp.]MCB4760704.1 3-methyl-2-oxobutanoate hydroxymethyltransferase [Sulfurovum sp.]